eukprot:g7905.t1
MTEQGLHDQAAMMIDAASEFVSSAARLCADKVESLHLLTAPVISEFFSTTRRFYEKMSLEDFTTTTYFAPLGAFVCDYRQELVTCALVLLAILFDLCLVAFLSKTKSSRHSSTPKSSSAASRTITPLLLAEDLPAKEEARETETVAHWIQAVGDIDKDDMLIQKEKIWDPEKITTDKIELPREDEQDVDHATATANGGPEMKPNPKADDSSDGILEVDGSGTSHGNVICTVISSCSY